MLKKKNSRTLVKDGKADFIPDHHSMHGDRGDRILLLRKQTGLLATRSMASGLFIALSREGSQEMGNY